MNKEQIIDEVYNKWIKYSWNNRIYPNQNDKDIFIDRIKTEPDFSIHWGLNIEEKELRLEERSELFRNTYSKKSVDDFAPSGMEIQSIKHQLNTRYDNANIPTKLIIIKYNDKTIESYE